MNKLKHHIYVSIHTKYKNPILPKLPVHIISYLLSNPQKLPIYLNPNIQVEDLLKTLHPNQPLLSQIISYMEEHNEPKWKPNSSNHIH